MIGCRPVENVVVAVVKCVGRGRNWRECVKDDTDELGLHPNGQCSGICGEALYQGKRLTLAGRGRNGHFKNKDDDDDDIFDLFLILIWS